ncbi:hypothetical protein [Streptomyces sp. NBC_00391]|uniref:hypothetical protein n=1 Tax=Streptomyces sp. NBC_00391 TaxID=2903647 RepID=UPI002E1FB4F1
MFAAAALGPPLRTAGARADAARTVAVYAEALRQLTLDYDEARNQIQQNADVTTLASRRNRKVEPSP